MIKCRDETTSQVPPFNIALPFLIFYTTDSWVKTFFSIPRQHLMIASPRVSRVRRVGYGKCFYCCDIESRIVHYISTTGSRLLIIKSHVNMKTLLSVDWFNSSSPTTSVILQSRETFSLCGFPHTTTCALYVGLPGTLHFKWHPI